MLYVITEDSTARSALGAMLSNGGISAVIAVADLQPLASPQQIAKSAEGAIRTANARGAKKIILIIDQENQDVCPGQIAARLEAELKKRTCEASVVIKVRSFENWLISDPDAFASLKDFSLSNTLRDKIQRNADNQPDALSILKQIYCGKGSYSKAKHSSVIAAKIDVDRAQAGSKSFEKFWRTASSQP